MLEMEMHAKKVEAVSDQIVAESFHNQPIARALLLVRSRSFVFQCVRNPLISRRYVTHPISLPILGWKTIKWMQRPCHKTVVKMYWIIGFHHAKNNRMAGTENAGVVW